MRGVVYIAKQQCAKLRAELGFTVEEAACRVGVSVARLRGLLAGVKWREAEGIPLATVKACIKRLASRAGYTIEEAAAQLGTSVEWVLDRKRDGTIKVSRAPWDRRRVYVSAPMLRRLREAQQCPPCQKLLHDDWLRLSEAAFEAGVTGSTIIHWAEDGELPRRPSTVGWRYHRGAVRARARTYWRTVRYRRATPPNWLRTERGAAGKANPAVPLALHTPTQPTTGQASRPSSSAHTDLGQARVAS